MATTRRRAPAKTSSKPTGRAGRQSTGRGKSERRLSKAEASVRERMAKEIARQQKRKEESAANFAIPYRFFVKRGEKAELIICDDAVVFARYEHNYKGESGRRDQYCACLQETEICPACSALEDSRPYYGMFLTVIDESGYTKANGEVVPFTKKLLVIKSQQQEKWNRRIDTHIEKYGTLRGAMVDVFRSDSQTSPATGDDIEFSGHIDLDSKESADTYYREYENREGKTITEDLREVVDYEELFKEPTVEELEEKFNVAPPAGSDRANRSAGRATRRGVEPEEDEGYEDEDADNVKWEDKAPSRGRPSASARPTRQAAKGRTRRSTKR